MLLSFATPTQSDISLTLHHKRSLFALSVMNVFFNAFLGILLSSLTVLIPSYFSHYAVLLNALIVAICVDLFPFSVYSLQNFSKLTVTSISIRIHCLNLPQYA
jgi:hypothetical protein